MTIIDAIPRRCVNLPPGALRTLLRCMSSGTLAEGPAIEGFSRRLGQWLGVPYVSGAFTGRSAFQLALEALSIEKGKEIIFPRFTFPVIPMVAKMLGYIPVFCDVDPLTFNAGPKHFEARMTGQTAAFVATHLFGQPCSIREIVDLARSRNIWVLEDCAHACGVRVDGQQVGTFGNIGVFSFAEGKNMPCFGGGAIATRDETVAQRASVVLSRAPVPSKEMILKNAFSVLSKWLLTRPSVFGLTAYPVLRWKLLRGQSLMDSAVGDELLGQFSASSPRVTRFANLQAEIGLLHLDQIDAFNEGARRNAQILTEGLGGAAGIELPPSGSGDPIFVYYPLTVKGGKRDHLRHYLLRHGFDSKLTDMSDCRRLRVFREEVGFGDGHGTSLEDSLLELCVYPVISEGRIRRLAQVIRNWDQG